MYIEIWNSSFSIYPHEFSRFRCYFGRIYVRLGSFSVYFQCRCHPIFKLASNHFSLAKPRASLSVSKVDLIVAERSPIVLNIAMQPLVPTISASRCENIMSSSSQFGLDIDPQVALPFEQQPSTASMIKMRRPRRYFFVTVIHVQKTDNTCELMARLISDALPCRRYIIVQTGEVPTPPGEVVIHILLELNPPVFCVEAWLILERLLTGGKAVLQPYAGDYLRQALPIHVGRGSGEPFVFQLPLRRRARNV